MKTDLSDTFCQDLIHQWTVVTVLVAQRVAPAAQRVPGTRWRALRDIPEDFWGALGHAGTLPEAAKALKDALEQFQADNKAVRILQEALHRRNYCFL